MGILEGLEKRAREREGKGIGVEEIKKSGRRRQA